MTFKKIRSAVGRLITENQQTRIIIWLSDITFTDAKTTLMLSFAPIGAMGLIFASIYNVKTDVVVRSGILTYIIALFLIPLVGSVF